MSSQQKSWKSIQWRTNDDEILKMAKEYLKKLLERQRVEQTKSKIILPQSFVWKSYETREE